MINAIIFSKDRAMQLRLLLESIQLNAPNIFNLNILYKTSTEEHKRGYDKLKFECENLSNNNLISFFYEKNEFKKQTIELLNSNYDYSCFFTDDDIIYKKINEEQITNCFSDIDLFCFSLRLGLNITKCYSMQSENVVIPLYQNDEIIKWDWSQHYMDFGYPLSVDGHIFKTKDILKLSSNIGFKNPNTYEAALQIYDNYPKFKMASFKNSVLVNTPVNIVQNVFENRKGEKYNYPIEELNKLYLEDKIISLEEFDFDNIIGCHQELNFKIKSNK